MQLQNTRFSKKEELANAISHGIGHMLIAIWNV